MRKSKYKYMVLFMVLTYILLSLVSNETHANRPSMSLRNQNGCQYMVYDDGDGNVAITHHGACNNIQHKTKHKELIVELREIKRLLK